MIRLFKVSELLENIKITLSENFPVVDVYGEIGEVNANSKSGHIYFNLKEDKNVISCAVWKNNADKLKDAIAEGRQVKIRGRVLSYPTNSKFYINVAAITADGLGESLKNLSALKEKLTAEGLFLDSYKKPIAKYPKSIGLITSIDGDVINDIKTTLGSSFPCKIYLYDVPVQGTDSVNKIIAALEYFDSLNKNIPDFLIIARGGGSAEDLFHYNDETLVRTIFKVKIPIIMAVGHDPDSSLADLAADKSVATPTASVAFLGNNLELQEDLKVIKEHLGYLTQRKLSDLSRNLTNSAKLLKTPIDVIKNQEAKIFYLLAKQRQVVNHTFERYKSSLNIYEYKIDGMLQQVLNNISRYRQKVDFFLSQTQQKMIHTLANYEAKTAVFASKVNNFAMNIKASEQKLFYLSRMLESLSFKETLKRGFSVVSQQGKIVKSVQSFEADKEFEIEFFDGKKSINK
ncbi:MAG: exodeoxyribonuclease VII large subunit [Alphaproteobacteria bacterium]|nr:exodeoxyribonuclease VII large subunit [Alphaproteobacteria bacterium]